MLSKKKILLQIKPTNILLALVIRRARIKHERIQF